MRLGAKAKMAVLPDQIDKSINKITSAFDDIPKAITTAREMSTTLEECALDRKPNLGFQRDKRYIRLQKTEDRVRTALTKSGGPKVVWLHGGPGRGKSCLARDVALQIESSVDMDLSQQSDPAPSSSLDSNQWEKFDKVVYIECGREAQISTIQLVLLQKFGKGAHATDDRKAPVDSTTLSILKSLLQSQKKILIILDDVWELNIAASIINLCGNNVKCLLTSQNANLCRSLNCSQEDIPIERIDSKCAKKILASHILGNQDGTSGEMYSIPKDVEVLAEKLLHQVDANPLALACVATCIDRQSFEDVQVWQKVVDHIGKSLDYKDTAMINNFGYRSSFWAALQLSFERLPEEEEKLFILVSLCRGPFVPEEVVEYLYNLSGVGFFLKAKRHLEYKRFIQTRENYCSIHSLLQIFADRNFEAHKFTLELQLKELSKGDGKKEISKSDQEVDPDILEAIISLYFEGETVSTVDPTTDTSIGFNVDEHVLEPITRLLLSDNNPRTKLPSHVREVFLKYVKSGSIDEEAAIALLQSPNLKCIAVVIEVLVRFAQGPNNNVSVGDGVVCALLGLLSDKDMYKKVDSMSQNDLLWEAADAIYWLQKLNTKHGKAFDLKNTTLFACFTKALEKIRVVMEKDDDLHFQRQAIVALRALSDESWNFPATPRILGKLINMIKASEYGISGNADDAEMVLFEMASGGDEDQFIKISNGPTGLEETGLEELVSALETDTSCSFKSKSVWWSLAILFDNGSERVLLKSSGIKESGIKEPFEKLLHVLIKASNPQLQLHAALVHGVPAFLVYGLDLCIKNSNVLTGLEELISGLEVDSSPEYQALAARALDIFAENGGVSLQISGNPKSLEKLAHALTKTSNLELQKQAAWVLEDLAGGDGRDLFITSYVPRALEELASELETDTSPHFQATASLALEMRISSISGGRTIDVDMSSIPASLDKLAHALTKASNTQLQISLEKLKDALTKASNPELQEQAALVLVHLARRGDRDLCIKISNVPTALEELLSALEMDTSPHFQATAAWALAILSDNGGEGVVLKISSIPESLEKLVRALTKASNPELQEQAALVLVHLARKGGRDLCIKISNVPTALEELLSALETDTSPHFQATAVWALAILSVKGGERVVLEISTIPESLEKLAHALTKASNPQLQELAACVLGHWAHVGGRDLCIQISNVPRTLEELLSALEMDSSPMYEALAALLLQSLAENGGESVVLKISSIPESSERLAHALTKASNPQLQKHAALVLATLAFHGNHNLCHLISNVQGSFSQLANGLERSENVDGQFNFASQSDFPISATCNSEVQLKLAELPGLIESLVRLASENINSPKLDASALAIRALTLIDTSRGQEIVLNSAHSYQERGFAELLLGLYKESLKDLNEASRIQPVDWGAIPDNLSHRITVKARLADFPGALADADRLIEISRTGYHLQERGVLKCMMKDLPGALKDLDEALNLDPNDYECLKHRGYVKFLLQDEIGARADAEKALEIKPPRVDFKHYGRTCLGVSSVNYMGYQLR